MDAIQIILRDHREIDRLLKELERSERGDQGRRTAAARALVRELSIHAVVEEQLVYPALRDAGAEARVLDALEEHHAAKLTLDELDALPVSHPRFASKVRLLAENVRRHVDEEERELLPLLERALEDGRLRALGEDLVRARRAAPTRPHPAAPDTPPANVVVGAAAAIVDRTRDALRGATDMLRTLGAQGTRWLLELAWMARRRGTEAVREAAEQGRVAVETGVERGRQAMDGAREATARLEVRGAEAANVVADRSRSAARRARAGKRQGSAAARRSRARRRRR